MIFMGEEFGAETPFLFFCDFEKDLAGAVTAGRRAEFAQFAAFGNPAEREQIPDPNAATTFETSRLNWNAMAQPEQQEWIRLHRRLMQIRRQHIAPRLAAGCALKASYEIHGDRGLKARWGFSDNSELILLANLGNTPMPGSIPHAARIIYANEEVSVEGRKQGTLPAWSVVWCLES
jgi:1,4-alpha-glucan branching enzyme